MWLWYFNVSSTFKVQMSTPTSMQYELHEPEVRARRGDRISNRNADQSGEKTGGRQCSSPVQCSTPSSSLKSGWQYRAVAGTSGSDQPDRSCWKIGAVPEDKCHVFGKCVADRSKASSRDNMPPTLWRWVSRNVTTLNGYRWFLKKNWLRTLYHIHFIN